MKFNRTVLEFRFYLLSSFYPTWFEFKLRKLTQRVCMDVLCLTYKVTLTCLTSMFGKRNMHNKFDLNYFKYIYT